MEIMVRSTVLPGLDRMGEPQALSFDGTDRLSANSLLLLHDEYNSLIIFGTNQRMPVSVRCIPKWRKCQCICRQSLLFEMGIVDKLEL